MKIKRVSYSSSFKEKVVNEYLTTDLSQRELMTKYGIQGKNSISLWVKAREQKELDFTRSKNPTLDAMKSKDERELLKRIAELEKALENAELKAIAYQKLVDNAEKELGIRLPKKSSTKRSKS